MTLRGVWKINVAIRSIEVYGEDIGKFVIIRFSDPESTELVKAYGVLTGFTHLGHLIVKGPDQTRHIDPQDIKNYFSRPDKHTFKGGGQNRR